MNVRRVFAVACIVGLSLVGRRRPRLERLGRDIEAELRRAAEVGEV